MTAANTAVASASRRAGLRPAIAFALKLLGTAAAYYIAARLGLELALVGESITPLWPPTGVALVASLAFGYRVWPAIAVAALAVNIPISPSLGAAAGIAVGNTLAPLAAAMLLRRSGFHPEMERVREAASFVFLGALSMGISATIGTASLVLSGAVAEDRFLESWSVWWTGDAMGVLIVAPFLWVLWPTGGRGLAWRRVLEGTVLHAGVVAAALLALAAQDQLLFLVVPLVGWLAWRFQQRGAAPAALASSLIVTWAAVHDLGPFAGDALLNKMIVVQGFNLTVAFTSFFFASAVVEKLRSREALERSAGELEEAVSARTEELTAANERLVDEVAERARAQEVLEQRELQLAEAQLIAHLGSWEWDIERNRIRWSDELYRIYGLHPQEFPATYEAYLDSVHPDDRELVHGVIERALSDAAEFVFDHRIIRPDGTEGVIHSRGSVIAEASGAPVRMVGTAQDITERSIADRALRESEERFRIVFESAAFGMAQCDAEGRILKTNLALQNLTGYSDDELAARNYLDLSHDGDRERNADLFARLLGGQLSSFDIEKQVVRADGRRLWVHDSVSLARDSEGAPKFVHVIVQDVTERRRAEALQRAEAERERLHELFSEVPAVVLVTRGPEHVIEFANDALHELLGQRDVIGKPLRDAIPGMEPQGHLRLFDEVYDTGEPFVASEAPLSLASGSEPAAERFFNLVYQPVRAHSGDIEGVLAHAVDVTETIRGRERATESLAFLDTLLQTSPAGFAVFDGDLRYVRVNERFAEINQLPVEAHLGRSVQDVVPRLAEALEPILRRVLETSEPVIDVEMSAGSRSGDEEKHWLASYYPILAPEGEALGVGAVVVEITERKRFERLLSGQKEVLELVARGADQPSVLDALARTAEDQSRGDTRACILLVDEQAQQLRLGAAPSLPVEYAQAIDGLPIGPLVGSCGAAAATRQPVLVEDIGADPKWTALRELSLRHGLRAAWSWPVLAADGAVMGTFCLYCTQPRLPTDQERELLDVLTRTASIAIERQRAEHERQLLLEREREAQSQLYQREHHVAETLQRSLLPEALPDTPGVEVAARYLPATADVEVGGDWYDIIPLPGARLGLAIGDVAGHGIAAAAAMGQMRMALRAYALEELSPAEALGRLNRLLLELQPGAMSTVIYSQFDPATGEMRFASAGHPPPLLLGADGHAAFLEGGLAPPLGVAAEVEYLESHARIDVGATLLLYTDGLIEKRREPIDDGLALLRQVASSAPEALQDACDHIVSSLLGGGVSDDVALLAIRSLSFEGHPLRVRRPSAPSTVPELRRVLRRWLAHNGADGDEAYDILVAFTEACTNAVQHAYGGGQGAIDVEAILQEGDTLITIRDYGAWKLGAPNDSDDGGRGLRLMQGLMDNVEVASNVDGTEVRMRRGLGALMVSS